jgi:hypothetical protein
MLDEIELVFPRLRGANYQVTSPATDAYNYVAWAAGDAVRWWWPGNPKAYWPNGVPGVESLQSFRGTFESLGYVRCPTGELEPEHEKVALFADAAGTPTHVARQLPTGRWSSKLGLLADIEHSLPDLDGGAYGSVVEFMKRRTR